MTDNITQLPEPGVTLDLDALERPAKDIKPPFVVKVNERKITFADPNDMDWRDVASVQIPADLFHVALSKEDRNFLLDQELSTFRMAALFKGYYDHYDFEQRVRDAQRRSQFGG